MITTFSDLFNHEQLRYDYPRHITMKDLLANIQFYHDIKTLKLSDDKRYVENLENEFAKGTIDFGFQLIIPLLDTYHVVLLAIDHICGRNIVLNRKTLISEFHSAFKTLYLENLTIPYLSSCIKEIIKTALQRYEEAGFISV